MVCVRVCVRVCVCAHAHVSVCVCLCVYGVYVCACVFSPRCLWLPLDFDARFKLHLLGAGQVSAFRQSQSSKVAQWDNLK